MDNQNITIPLRQLESRFRGMMIRLPVLVGNEVVNFALDSFKNQAWLGDTVQRWKPRKNPNKWGQAPKRNGRAILVDSGRLRRSIRVTDITQTSVTIGTDVPYARAHNEGLRLGFIQNVKSYQRKVTTLGIVKTKSLKTRTNIQFGRVQTGKTTVSAHKRRIDQNIPRRQFLGQSPYLNARLKRLVGAEILKATSRSLSNFRYNA